MSLQRFIFALSAWVFWAAICFWSCDAVPAQEQPSAQAPVPDKYFFDGNAFRGNPREGVIQAGKLINEAMANEAPAATIAGLQYAQALMAHRCHDLINREQMVVAILRPIVDDPSPLLGDAASAKTFVSVVQLYCSPMYKDAVGPVQFDETIRRAIENTNSATALSERDRLHVTARLALFGSDLGENPEMAIEWLNPYVDARDRFAEDTAGASILCQLVSHCGYYYTKLGRLDDRGLVIQAGVKALKESSQLPEHEKLMHVSRILSRQLLRLENHASDPDAPQAWLDAQEHLKLLEAYAGPRELEVRASGIEISRYSIHFLGNRDFDQSMKIVEKVTRQFTDEPELVHVEQAVPNAFYMSMRLLELLTKANDSRAENSRRRLEAFLDQLDPIVPDKSSIRDYRSFLPQRPGS